MCWADQIFLLFSFMQKFAVQIWMKHLSYPVFCTAKNQLVTTNYSLVDWILFTKAHDVSTKRPVGDSQVFLVFPLIQKFAVQIWMTRIKWWKAGVNASFVLLALRKYLRAKECILWWNGFSWDHFFTLFFQTFHNKTFTANYQLITIGLRVINQL